MDIFVARTAAELDAAYKKLSGSRIIGCDTETSGLNSKYGKIFSIQFSDGEFNLLIPLSEGVEPGPFTELLADAETTKIFHNAKFDLDFLSANGIWTENVYDTMIAEKVLTRGAGQSASLADTLYRHFAVDLDKTPRSKFNKKWDGVWTDELIDYALADVVYLPRLMAEQLKWLGQLGLTDEFHKQMNKVMAEQGKA